MNLSETCVIYVSYLLVLIAQKEQMFVPAKWFIPPAFQILWPLLVICTFNLIPDILCVFLDIPQILYSLYLA